MCKEGKREYHLVFFFKISSKNVFLRVHVLSLVSL